MSLLQKKIISGSGEVVSIETDTFSLSPLLDNYNSNTLLFTVEQLLKKSTICPRFRFFVLNFDESIRYEIPQEDILLGGNYQENYQNGQRRSISISLNNENGKYTPSVGDFWFNTKFLFEVGLENPINDSQILWFKKGVYFLSDISLKEDEQSKTINLELKDKFGLLEGARGRLTTSYEVLAGEDVRSVIESILLQEDGNGHPMDPAPIAYSTQLKGTKIQQKISGEAGETWGDILLQLAQQASAEMFYNAEGKLTLVPIYEVVDESSKPVLYNFFSNEGDFSSINYNFDFNSVYNRIIVMGNNINGKICKAIAENKSAQSPISISKIGYRTAEIISDPAIYNEVLAKERAEYELRKSSILQTSVSNTVYFNPILSVNNLITVTDDFLSKKQETLLIQSISFSIDYSGVMQIENSNIRNFSFLY